MDAHRASHFSDLTEEFHQKKDGFVQDYNVDLDKEIYYVCNVEGLICGFVEGSVGERSKSKLSKLGSVDELFVLPEFRGKGIAQELLTQLEADFKESGCDHVVTFTDIENSNAQSTYEKFGMQKATIEYWKKI